MLSWLIAAAVAQTNFDFSVVRDSGSPMYWNGRGAKVEEGALVLRASGEKVQSVWQNHTPVRRRFRVRARMRVEGVPLGTLLVETGDEKALLLGELHGVSTGMEEWQTLTSQWIELPEVPDEVTVMVRVEGAGALWVDDIELLDEEGVFPAAATPDPRPTTFSTSLWRGDAQRVPALGAKVAAADAAWVSSHHRAIRSLGSTDTRDLRFLRRELRGVEMVQLGESSHGGESFNALRGRMIRYLHEKLGYNVLAFESSAVSCARANRLLAEGKPLEAMKASVYAVWWTAELLATFKYLAETHQTDTPLWLAGFDAQFSGVGGRSALADVMGEMLASHPVRVQAWTDILEEQDAIENLDVPARRKVLLERVSEELRWIEEHRSELAGDPVERASLVEWLHAQPRMIRHREPGFFAEGQRDLAMGELLVGLQRVHPGEKIISWAHNFHVRYDGASIHGGTPSHGEVVREALGEKVFTIGMYTGSGRHALNNGDVVWIAPPPDGSLEAILSSAEKRVAYVPLRGARGNGWMESELHTWDFGQMTERLVPVDNYDALIYIHEMSPPAYVQ